MNNYNTDDIIFALATGFVRSAIAIIRVSGEGCIGRIERYFESRKPLSSYGTNTAVYGTLFQTMRNENSGEKDGEFLSHGNSESNWREDGFLSHGNSESNGREDRFLSHGNSENSGKIGGDNSAEQGVQGSGTPQKTNVKTSLSDIIDNCIITIYKGGHGYTGEEALEISLHGSLNTVKTTLGFLSSVGFRQAERGEFTFRAFLHHKMDLTQAEAVNELINSESSRSRKASLSRLNGSLLRSIESVKRDVLEIMSIIEVQLDYSEDEIGENLDFPEDKIISARNSLMKIAGTYRTGRLYKDGAKIVLAGAPNAGKSSLFNLFLNEDRAIVSEIKGTTRDYIEASCVVNDIPVKLYDTAGLRAADNIIEAEGVKKSYSLLDEADVILYLVDGANPEIEDRILSDKRCIPLLNKTDLNPSPMDGFSGISVKTGEGFADLCLKIEEKVKEGIDNPSEEALEIESSRQRDNLNAAIESLDFAISHYKEELPIDIVSLDIQEALNALAELTGEVATDDILDKIFSSFCVGK